MKALKAAQEESNEPKKAEPAKGCLNKKMRSKHCKRWPSKCWRMYSETTKASFTNWSIDAPWLLCPFLGSTATRNRRRVPRTKHTSSSTGAASALFPHQSQIGMLMLLAKAKTLQDLKTMSTIGSFLNASQQGLLSKLSELQDQKIDALVAKDNSNSRMAVALGTRGSKSITSDVMKKGIVSYADGLFELIQLLDVDVPHLLGGLTQGQRRELYANGGHDEDDVSQTPLRHGDMRAGPLQTRVMESVYTQLEVLRRRQNATQDAPVELLLFLQLAPQIPRLVSKASTDLMASDSDQRGNAAALRQSLETAVGLYSLNLADAIGSGDYESYFLKVDWTLAQLAFMHEEDDLPQMVRDSPPTTTSTESCSLATRPVL